MSNAIPPMPDTASAGFPPHAVDLVREHLNGRGYPRAIAYIPTPDDSMIARMADSDSPVMTTAAERSVALLDIQKCVGPAPFIGDARTEQGWYVWYVASGKTGEYVAGSAHLDISWRP